MKPSEILRLSEALRQDHESGDFGQALEGYAEEAEEMEKALYDLSLFFTTKTPGLAVHEARIRKSSFEESVRDISDEIIAYRKFDNEA